MYEREQGKIRCPMREINNDRRFVGAWVVDGRGRSGHWKGGPSGSGRRFTGVKSGSESSWPKTAGGCWGGFGCGGSWAADCERSAELGGRQRRERVSLGKAHSEAVRGIERKEGAAYRSGLEGSEDVGGGEDGRALTALR